MKSGRVLGILATLLGAVLLIAAVRRLDLGAVGDALGAARLWPWLPLAIASYLAGHVCRGKRLRRLVSGESMLSVPTATNVVVVGYAVNNILPARLGELARAWMLTERSGLSFTQCVTVTILERLLDGLVLLLLLAVVVPMLPAGWSSATTAIFAGSLLTAAAAVIAAGVALPGLVLGIASRAAEALVPRHYDTVLQQVQAVLNGLAYVRRPRAAFAVARLSIAVWLFEAGMFLLLLPAFGLAANPVTALYAMTITNLSMMLPSTPGFIGPFHYFCMQAVASSGVAREVAFGYAVLVHLAFYAPVTLWGLGVLVSHGLSVSRAVALRREARPLAPLSDSGARAHWSAHQFEAGEPAASRLTRALAEAALPPDPLRVEAGVRDDAVRHVARFVEGQLRMLPVRLRMLLVVGLLGFRIVTRLVYLRGFCELDEVRRRTWFERWAYGRFALARQLFRGIRSTAILAYYEIPAVRAALNLPSAARPVVERARLPVAIAGLELDALHEAHNASWKRATVGSRHQVIVIGSGAGGAVTAFELARAGFDVVVIEEGSRTKPEEYGHAPSEAMRRLYRQRGMMPIVGSVPIGYVEGSCLGGSTEINSGFWSRAPREVLLRWRAQYDLTDAAESDLAPHYAWGEEMLGVSRSSIPWPPSTRVFARGIEAMGWSYDEVPRTAPGCRHTNACASGCPTGAKQGMSRSIIPLAEIAGASLLTGCRALQLLCHGPRVTGVVIRLRDEDGVEHIARIEADQVFVCGGPTETPALLQRSGIRYHIGNTLRVHPYLKVAALYDEEIHAERSVLPLVQVKQFAPEVSLGGAFFTLGHLAMTLSDNWPLWRGHMVHHARMAQYYVGIKGSGRGSVRPDILSQDRTLIRYDLSLIDLRNLSVGLARLSTLLLAGGARAVFPSVQGLNAIESDVESARWLDDLLPRSSLSLVTVHAFSSCPIGERRDRCAADSFGKVYGFENLYINDASMLPDSAGVNPQATIMAIARRNVLHFMQDTRRH